MKHCVDMFFFWLDKSDAYSISVNFLQAGEMDLDIGGSGPRSQDGYWQLFTTTLEICFPFTNGLRCGTTQHTTWQPHPLNEFWCRQLSAACLQQQLRINSGLKIGRF